MWTRGRAAQCKGRNPGHDPHSHKALSLYFRERRQTVETFIQIVQQLGFPIAAVIALFIMLQNEQKEHKAETEQIRDGMNALKMEFTGTIHSLESHTTEAINNNTLVMQRLLDKLEEK